MHTVFSHIIQKRFSQVKEDVATDALAYLLETSEAARRGMSRLLRGITPDLPVLQFKTQQADGAIRPDMCGVDGQEIRLFIENKFWAGLTDNQPVSYLQTLSAQDQSTILLVVAPATRLHTLWRELGRRLEPADISGIAREAVPGIPYLMSTSIGPTLALTSWTNVLSALEHEAVDDPGVRGDLAQLRSLCDIADSEAFTPISASELSDQRTPALLLNLTSIVQEVTSLAVSEDVVNTLGLRPQSSWERMGQYIKFSGPQGVGFWFGTHLTLWKQHGSTPMWAVFAETDFSRGAEVRNLIGPWAARNDILTATYNSLFAIALEIPAGEEKAQVVRSVVDAIKAIGLMLETLPPLSAMSDDLE